VKYQPKIIEKIMILYKLFNLTILEKNDNIIYIMFTKKEIFTIGVINMKVFVLILMIWLLISCNKSVKENITNESLQDLSNSISITNIELIEKKLEQIEQIQDIDYLIIKEDSVEIPFFFF
jgi:hypothetical protein